MDNLKFLIFALLVASGQSFSVSSSIIYGVEAAKNYKNNSTKDFYLQAGTFLNKANASRYQKILQSKIVQPIIIKRDNDYYVVRVGPLHSDKEVRILGQHISQSSNLILSAQYNPPTVFTKTQPIITPNKNYSQLTKNGFVSLDIGNQWAKISSSITVPNGSDFPPPLNVDSLSTKKNRQLLVGTTVGKRWRLGNTWLPFYSLGLRYRHVFAKNIGNTVMQYSMPEFTNYNYNLKISSDVLFASATLTLFQYSRFSPFINGGLGIAFNHTSNYTETALSNVTPRINPGFESHTRSQVAYNLGIGVDFLITEQISLSAGYEFQDFGKISSGKGMDTWLGQSLNLGSYQLNTLSLSIRYLLPC